jgi:hypothetical protein
MVLLLRGEEIPSLASRAMAPFSKRGTGVTVFALPIRARKYYRPSFD